METIEREQKFMKENLQKKLESIQVEKESLLKEIQQEESARVGNLQAVIERILAEKNDLEVKLSKEVTDKQHLVLTLERQKSGLTQDLKNKLIEIQKNRSLIERRLGNKDQGIGLMNKQKQSSNNSTPRTEMQRKNTQEEGQREGSREKNLFERDKEYYDQEQKRMMAKILTLTTQLDQAKGESLKYKKIWEKVRLRPGAHPHAQKGRAYQIQDSSVENSLYLFPLF